jgi:hypothetical protein
VLHYSVEVHWHPDIHHYIWIYSTLFDFTHLLESYFLISERGEFIIIDLPHFISTADVTYQHLKGAMVVGNTPFKALKADPRISYSLYMPPEHLNPDPSLQSKCGGLNLVYKPPPPLATGYQYPRNRPKRRNCRDPLIDFAHSERVAVLALFSSWYRLL